MPSRNRPQVDQDPSLKEHQHPKRSLPQTRRQLSLETLEKRYLMTGAEGEFTEAQLNTIHDIEYALTEEQLLNEQARDTLAISSITEQTRQDMITFSDLWKTENAELVQDTARFDTLTAEQQALGMESQDKFAIFVEKSDRVEEAEQRIQDLSSQATAIRQALEGMQAQQTPLLEERNQVQERAAYERQQLNASQTTVDNLLNRQADWQQKLPLLRSRLDTYEQGIEELRQLLQRKDGLEQAMEETDADIEGKVQARANVDQLIDRETRENWQPLCDEATKLVDTFYGLQDRIAALDKEHADLEQHLPEAEAALAEATAQLETLLSQWNKTEAEILSVERNLEQTQSRISRLENMASRFPRVRSSGSQLDQLLERRTELQRKLTSLKELLEKLADQILVAQQVKFDVSQSLDTLRARADAVSVEKHTAEETLHETHDAYQQICTQINVVVERIEKLTDESVVLYGAINGARNLRQAQQQENDGIIAEISARTQSLTDEREALRLFFADLTGETRDINPAQDLPAFKEALQVFEGEYGQFADAFADLPNWIAEYTGRVEAFQRSLEQLNARLEELTNLINANAQAIERLTQTLEEVQTTMEQQTDIRDAASAIVNAIRQDILHIIDRKAANRSVLDTLAADVAQHRQSVEDIRASLHAAVEKAMEESEIINPVMDVVTGNRQVTVQFQSPHDASNLDLVPPDLTRSYTYLTVEHPGGTRTGTATLILPIGLPARQVLLRLKDPEDNVIATMTLIWNGQRFTDMYKESAGSVAKFVDENPFPPIDLTDPGVRENFAYHVASISHLYPTLSARDVAKNAQPWFFGATPAEDEEALLAYAHSIVLQNPGLNEGRLVDSLRQTRQDLITQSQRTINAACEIIQDVADDTYYGVLAGEQGDFVTMNARFAHAENWWNVHSERRNLIVPLAYASAGAIRGAVTNHFYELYEEQLFWEVQDEQCKQRILNLSTWGLIGTTILPDGTIIRPNGKVYHPDGKEGSMNPEDVPKQIPRSTAQSRQNVLEWMVLHWNDSMLDGFRDIEDPAERRLAMLETLYGDHNLWTDTGMPPPEDGKARIAPKDLDVKREVGGGSDDGTLDLSTLDAAITMTEVMGWYQETSSGALENVEGYDVRKDTTIGRIFLGLAQQMPNKTMKEFRAMCSKAEKITGISGERLANPAVSGDYNRFITNLVNVFKDAGHEAIFNGNPNYTPNDLMHVRTEDVYYTNGTIRVFFDLPQSINGKAIGHSAIYLLRGDTGEKLHNNPLTGEIRNQLYTDIPASYIGHLNFPQGFKIKLVSWPEGATDDSERIYCTSSEPFFLEWDGLSENPVGDYSTLPEGPAHEREKIFLSELTFPVAPGDWSFGMGSTEHDGLGLYAIDFNVAGDADKDRTVRAACRGTVTQVDLEQGKVAIQYDNLDGTHYKITTYHMTHIFEDLTGITYLGAQEARVQGADENAEAVKRANAQAAINALITQVLHVSADARLGKVGDEGYSFGYHLDFRIHLSDGTPVNTYRWADAMQPGFPVKGTVGNKELTMHWSDGAMTLVNDAEQIAMKRVNIRNDENEVTGAENLAYAWESGKQIGQMTRVMWDEGTGAWYEVDMNGTLVSNDDGKKHIWLKNESSSNYHFIWQ
jgi:predicted  nucleic acid-binding Zn-ribbon protein